MKKIANHAQVETLKKRAALEALNMVEHNTIVGVGTGSTTNYFIDALADIKHNIEGCVASSEATEKRLKSYGIPVFDLNSVQELPLYVDGADEADPNLCLVKGGGGALTREKIIAAVAKTFVCIADVNKKVDVLGDFPLPVEVIPIARSYVAREIVKLGGSPVYREGFITDNGNIILDIRHFKIPEPIKIEQQLNQITGVVTNGLFASRPADVLLLAHEQGVDKIENS